MNLVSSQRRTSPLINKTVARTKTVAIIGNLSPLLSASGRVIIVVDDMTAKIDERPPFELAEAEPAIPHNPFLQFNGGDVEDFLKEFKSLKAEVSSLRDKVDILEAERSLKPKTDDAEAQPLPPAAELLEMIEQQNVQNKALKKELKEALKSQKDQIQRILQDQKRFLESSVVVNQESFNALKEDLTKCESAWKAELSKIDNRLVGVEKKTNGIMSGFLGMAESVKSHL
jgi:hypothetical protein